MSSEKVELLQGTLDLIILRALSTMGAQHAYGLAARLAQVSDHPLSLNQGTLYPALVRLEQKGWIKGTWQTTDNNREAKFYAITKTGTRALEKETERWRRLARTSRTSKASVDGEVPPGLAITEAPAQAPGSPRDSRLIRMFARSSSSALR